MKELKCSKRNKLNIASIKYRNKLNPNIMKGQMILNYCNRDGRGEGGER